MLISLSALAALAVADAAAPATEVSTTTPATANHWLLNPVPQDQMRELTTDRPDMTESPISVDAGHLQLELDAAVLAVDRSLQATPGLTVLGANVKVGLTSSTDLQLVLPAIATGPGGGAALIPGDALIRFKWNLVGNDGGDFSLALMPFVTMHFDTTDGSLPLDGGVIVPWCFALPGDFGWGSQVVLEGVRDGKGGFEPALAVTSSVSHDIVWGLAGYLEAGAFMRPYVFSDSVVIASGGLTLALGGDAQLDAGVRVPVIASAGDVEGFLGVSVRR
jgi:hypothetical protein